MKPLLYKNASVASEKGKPKKLDVLVEDGVITQVAKSCTVPKEAEEIDLSGQILLPAMFDIHVHARQPGREDKEDIKSCSEAAINGGVTGIILMPNTTPAIDNAGMVHSVLNRAAVHARIPVHTAGCITKGREGKELAGISGMKKAGVLLLTDDGDPVPDPQVLRLAMEYAVGLDLPLASHAETPELSGKGSMNEGPVSYRLGLAGVPAASEEICIERDCRLAQLTGARLNIQHVSSERGMEICRRFKEEGVAISCEISPHHLIFNEGHIGDYDTHYKMNPPLRTAEDNAALLQGLIDGVFDVIATDHAPHTPFEKALDFASAPFGITGLETAVPSLYHHFIKPGVFGWDLLVERYSAQPRRMYGFDPVPIEEGKPAEFIAFDPEASTTFSADFMQSKSNNTPFLDQTLDGQVTRVVLGKKTLLKR